MCCKRPNAAEELPCFGVNSSGGTSPYLRTCGAAEQQISQAVERDPQRELQRRGQSVDQLHGGQIQPQNNGGRRAQ
jgi:hypothetical protein